MAEPPLRRLITFFLQDVRATATGLAVGFVIRAGEISVVKVLAMQARKPEFR